MRPVGNGFATRELGARPATVLGMVMREGGRLTVAGLLLGLGAACAPEEEVFPNDVELEQLRGWLEKNQVTHVALESTGVFWIPVWNVLERSERSSN